MMLNASLNIRVDSEIKKQAEALFEEFGFNIATAVNMFLRQAVRQRKIPFELKLAYPNVETIRAIEEAELLLSDPSTKRYKSAAELFAELDRS